MSTITISRTTSDNPDFKVLIGALDISLWERYQEATADYWANNIIEYNSNVVLVYQDNKAVACGCFKKYNDKTIELKRMFVSVDSRGLGLAKQIVNELELWAAEMNYSVSILETLHKQVEAINLYQKIGYVFIANYEPYIGLKNSICMKKMI